MFPSTKPFRAELCMVERVESFKPEFERVGFCEFCVLMESDVEIVNARPIKEAALSVSLRTQLEITRQRSINKFNIGERGIS